MNGAREYAGLFETGQYNRFYIVSSSHARGKTFHIQLLPAKEKAKPNGESNLCLNENAVEVYGVISGHPGWTESYGWKHKGEWVADFEKLVGILRLGKQAERETAQGKKDKSEKDRMKREKELLKNY